MAESEALLSTLQQLLHLANEQGKKGSTPVLFEAKFVPGFVNPYDVPDQLLSFSNIKRNQGGGLNATGDFFLVPVKGTYAFNVTFKLPHSDPFMFFRLKVNGVKIVLSRITSNDPTVSAVLKLNKGNRVTVCVAYRSDFLTNEDVEITFSGTLMHES